MTSVLRGLPCHRSRRSWLSKESRWLRDMTRNIDDHELSTQTMGTPSVSKYASRKTYHSEGTSEQLGKELGNVECTIHDTCSQALLGRGCISVSYATQLDGYVERISVICNGIQHLIDLVSQCVELCADTSLTGCLLVGLLPLFKESIFELQTLQRRSKLHQTVNRAVSMIIGDERKIS